MQMEPPKQTLGRNGIVVLPAILFILGIGEYILITFLTDSIANARRYAAAFTTFLYIVLWYLVGREVILGKPHIAILYAAGCAVGTFITCKDQNGISLMEKLWKKIKILGGIGLTMFVTLKRKLIQKD